jgi:hypothetical protein
VPIAVTTATTTRLITGATNESIYVTSWDVLAAGSGTIQLIGGTGATCGTATVNLTGAYPLAANVGLTKGTGNGAVLVVPSGDSLCAITSAAVNYEGSMSYAQF